MREPTWTEVDGVPVAWVDLPGPLTAALHFRVGVANETASTHGISHLVEHLALYGMHDRPYELNGMVDLVRTSFVARGRPHEIAEFLGTVCTRLGNLPEERVLVERKVLEAEAAGRSRSFRAVLLYWRYGAQAHGLPFVSEFGLNWLGPDAVRWWAATRFTRANALLVLTGPPPEGLRLPLPEGPANHPVTAVTVEPQIPGWSPVPAEGFAVGAEVTHRPGASSAASWIINSELSRVLRFEQGITYSVAGSSEAVDATRAHVVFSADADAERFEELRDGFLDVLERLAQTGPSPDLVSQVLNRRLRAEEDELTRSFLDSMAYDLVLGTPYQPFAEVRRRLLEPTVEEIAATFDEVLAKALFVVPAPVGMPPRYRELSVCSPGAVAGETFAGRTTPRALVVGPEGLSEVRGEQAVTVRWADAVAVLWWADGARSVLGRDGFHVRVVPADWHGGETAVARVDHYAPRAVAVPMPGDGPPPAEPAGDGPAGPTPAGTAPAGAPAGPDAEAGGGWRDLLRRRR